MARAHALGYRALAMTDECSVAGVVRAHVEAKKWGMKLLLGAEFVLDEGGGFVALARDLNGWGDLCEFITAARRAAPKGCYTVSRARSDFGLLKGCEIVLLPPFAINFEALYAICIWARGLFGTQLWLAKTVQHQPGDVLRQYVL